MHNPRAKYTAISLPTYKIFLTYKYSIQTILNTGNIRVELHFLYVLMCNISGTPFSVCPDVQVLLWLFLSWTCFCMSE